MSSPTPVRSEEPNPTLYSPTSLRFYDLVVQMVSHRLVWRCPYSIIDALYAAHVGAEHLEVGPGTGSTLARLPRTTGLRELHLVDLNPACLAETQRAVRHRVDTHFYKVGALSSWPLAEASVDSVGAVDVLHCLPGESILNKHALVDNAARVLRPGGVFFGATFLGKKSLGHTRAARRLLDIYNGKQNTMHNEGDTLTDLVRLLFTHPEFADVWMDVCGSVALWSATRVGGDQ